MKIYEHLMSRDFLDFFHQISLIFLNFLKKIVILFLIVKGFL